MRENIPAKLVAWSLTAPDSELAAILEHIDRLVAAREPSRSDDERPSCTRYSFQRSGRVWRVVFAGAEFHLDDGGFMD